MSGYLLQIAIGPVQDFISSARRTRDLWFGSVVLSEISKASAKAVMDAGGKLIFPNPGELEASLSVKENYSFNVANVILAEVSGADEEEAKKISDLAREAARGKWLAFVDDAFGIMKSGVDESAWTYQRHRDVFEFYSAWHRFNDEGDYMGARKKVARILAARKNLRDFEPWEGRSGIPKSSLDGRRESVLRSADVSGHVKGARIKKGEALDIVGCVKRAAGGKAQFPSVIRTALDSHIRGFLKNERLERKVSELMIYCEELASLGALARVDDDLFPFEGTVFLPARYDELAEGAEESDKGRIRDITGKMRRVMSQISSKSLEPYLAVLCADGDRMGRVISELDSTDKHREFSGTLSSYAANARRIVKNYRGSCVYSGGDDVLAFLPVDTALGCARELYEAFGSLWMDQTKFKFDTPLTLSVGVSIGHALEDLEFLLKFGRDAEKMAKGADGANSRNGLAVTVRARGNSEISIRERWKSRVSASSAALVDMSLDARLTLWAGHFAEGHIPSRFPYELKGVAGIYEKWANGATRDKAMQADALRVFKRKETNLGSDESRIASYLESVISGSHESIERLADEMLVAQWITSARLAAGG
jgi:CRISPR-associated protein Cmr2